MNVLHLLVSGGTGGIEVLMKNYARHSSHKNIFVFVWKSGEIAQLMEQNGASIYVTNAGEEGMVTTLKKIREICKKEQVDAVVSHNSAPLLKLALIYIKMTIPGIRAVAYAHANARDICEHKRKKGLLIRKWIHRMGFAAADGVVAISDSVRESLCSYLNVEEKKIVRIYNGTQILPTAPCESIRGKNPCLRLIYVGRLIQEKGVQNTLQALSKLSGIIPFSFTVVGEGPFRQELEALAKRSGLGETVRFLGNRPDVPELLSQAEVFIHLPEWDEGFGITVIEALSAGRLCVVSQRGALPEIIENGKNGFVVPVNDPGAVLMVLERIWQMPEQERSELQCCSRKRAEQFSMTVFAKELDDYLSRICD